MRKKRLIFSLLYNDGFFVQSRNFRLQKVGNIDWLLKNYNFKNIAKHIDELSIINVTKSRELPANFFKDVDRISEICFTPKVLGGSIKNIKDVENFFNIGGADKIVINTAMFDNPDLIREIVYRYGSQAMVGCFDFKRSDDGQVKFFKKNGSEEVSLEASQLIPFAQDLQLGEINLQSIGLDGTGFGLDMESFGKIIQNNSNLRTPIILSGGTGNHEHIHEALLNENLNAVNTANLLNFIGDSFKTTRELLISNKINLPSFY